MAIDTFSIPMPQAKFPGIVHVAPAVIGEDLHPITCINVSDILIRHRAYWRERGVDLSEPSASKKEDQDDNVPDQKDAADEACDDIGIVDAESLRFMFEISVDTSVSFDDGEVITMTDKEFQEAVSESYGVPMKLVTYEGTEEELERAKQLVIQATSRPWPFEDIDDTSTSGDEDINIQHLEPPNAMTGIELESHPEATTESQFYTVPPEVVAF
ncbi:hypothetical protein V8E54_011703 [Elaphomyces granulatus]